MGTLGPMMPHLPRGRLRGKLQVAVKTCQVFEKSVRELMKTLTVFFFLVKTNKSQV